MELFRSAGIIGSVPDERTQAEIQGGRQGAAIARKSFPDVGSQSLQIYRCRCPLLRQTARFREVTGAGRLVRRLLGTRRPAHERGTLMKGKRSVSAKNKV